MTETPPGSADKKKQFPYHRRSVRYTVRLRIQVQAEQEYEAWTQNLSKDGICFEIPTALPVGQTVELVLRLKEKSPAGRIACTCRIVWSEASEGGYRHGGQFASFEDAGFRSLKNYLETKA